MVVAEQYLQLAAASKFMRSIPLWVYAVPYLIHCLAVVALLRRGNRALPRPPLSDILADNTPDLSRLYPVLCWSVPVLLAVFLIVCALFSGRGNVQGFLVSFFRYTALLILLRSITVHVTLLPPCRSEHGITMPKASVLFVGHAYDKIFSGHTSIELLALLLAWRYNLLAGIWLGLSLILQVTTAFLMVPAGMHYTIDVILAYIITMSLFFLFHL